VQAEMSQKLKDWPDADGMNQTVDFTDRVTHIKRHNVK